MKFKSRPAIQPFKIKDVDPPMEFFITIPPVPSVNHLYFNCHGRRAMTTKGKEYKAGVGNIAIYQRQKQGWEITAGEKVVMELRVFWADRRRRDTDNIIKIIQDSFIGILYDDDRWVLPRIMDWNLDKDDPRVEIKLFKLN